MSGIVAGIFVYGTLMRGQCRAHYWPHAPLSIAPAEIDAELYDLGPYPTILAGQDRVAGELWQIRTTDLKETLRVLDEVEGYQQGGDDLYVRRVVACRLPCGNVIAAHAYYLADAAQARKTQRIPPGVDGLCRWRPAPR